MKFIIQLDGKKLKTINAKTAETVYSNYNKYCKENFHGCEIVSDTESFGACSWKYGDKLIKLIRID